MSPLKKKKLNLIRQKLDKLDNSLINIIKKRTLSVDNLLKIKKLNKHIVDKNREKKIFKNIKKKSIKKKIDPRITLKLWKAIISSYVEYQKKNIKKN